MVGGDVPADATATTPGALTSYQLSCDCWVTDWREYRIGDVLPCTRCDTLRTFVVGISSAPRLVVSDGGR